MTDKEAINKLKETQDSYLKDELDEAIETVLNLIQTQQEEIEEYERTLDIFDNREYRKRYLEEERAKRPKLLYPDADEIYKRYFEQKAEIEKKDRQLEIKDKYLELIYFLGVDYDGWNTVESLKSLIDDLIDYAKKAGNNDDKAPIYSGFNGEDFNILYERLENKGDIENG